MTSLSSTAAQLASQGVNYAGDIVTAARKHGLDPRLLAAVAAQETGGPGSNGGRNIVGDGGHGRGLFQIDDRWHEFARTAEAMDPAKNADYAAGMIAGGLRRYGGDVHKALSAYNAGSPDAIGTTTAWSDGKTLGYADSVLRHEAQLSGASIPQATLDDAFSDAQAEAGNASPLDALASMLQSTAWQPPSAPAAPTPRNAQPIDYDSYINGGNP